MRICVTGAEGFVGPYMVNELQDAGHEVIELTYELCDLTDEFSRRNFLKESVPDAIVHLAGLSGYEQCHRNPSRTWQVNTIMVEEFARDYADINPKGTFLFVSSGKVYKPQEYFVGEENPLEAADFYALTKLSADQRLIQLSDELPICILLARPFNHTGVGQTTGFLCPDLIMRLREQDLKEQNWTLPVGSLTSEVDLCDVRDIVRGYRLILENGQSGDVFNLGSGKIQTISDVVQSLEKIVKRKIKPLVSREFDRPYTQLKRIGSIEKINKSLGWEPHISLDQTLNDMWKDV